MKPQVFLDLDGPLLDNREKYFTLITHLLEGDVGQLTPETYWRRKQNREPESAILSEILPMEAIPFYEFRRIKCIEDDTYLRYDRVWPWVPQILAQWQQHCELFIVTMRKRRETLLRQLDFLELTPYFDHILSRDDNRGDAPVKVDLVRPYLNGAKACFVGDTEADIRAGKALGTTTFAVTCGIRNEEHLQKEEPHYLVEDLRAVPALFEKLP